MKRIVSIQDISCLGKCSLTVALPIISAMGVETCVIPTAVLSTHTAFKGGWTFRDLTDDIPEITAHWVREGFEFDALYTGYLGSERQIEMVADFFEKFGQSGALKIVDPAMGDYGKLYPGFDEKFAKKMATLCALADIAVPNITEACYMLGAEYIAEGYDEQYVKTLLKKLAALGTKYAVLTGVSFEKDKIGVMGYRAETDEFFSYYNDKVNAAYHGTGDIFASCLTGGLARGKTLLEALQIAADFTAASIRETKPRETGFTYGADFETQFPYLLKMLGDV